MAFDDVRRLQVLRDYRLLDSPPEPVFDNITQVTARLFDTPMALITLVDEKRQWFKSHYGLSITETPREHSFCDHAVRGGQSLLVADARADARFVDNPLVTADPHIRFYCGIPLRSPDGQALGALCVLDRKPRTLGPEQLETLSALARQVELEIELRRRLVLLEDALGAQRRDQRQRELLSAMIVHDLRSPLTAVLMLAPTLRVVDEGSRAAVQDLVDEAERMRRMLADLLDLSLHSMGELRLRLSDFVLQDQVWAVVRSMRTSGAERVRVELPAEPMRMHADPELVGRVLRNLLGNALHHGPAGAPVRLHAAPLPAGGVRVQIRDKGAPIPPELRARMFAPFEQATPGVRSQQGHGLGLAFCRMAVEAHGGTIGIAEPAPGEPGNAFQLDLPSRPS